MSLYGYSRVNNKKYVKKLKNIRVKKIFIEKSIDSENELKKLLSLVQPKDEILVPKINLFTKNIVDLSSIVSTLNVSGISVTFIDDNLTFKCTPNNK
ncbi:recombinase family protein [Enterococcus faecalis]|uniref:recombinase family protein n=1 Tax=Enterococcus TaxID=1350 RepID=UPI001B8DB3C8|nr:recombinase family protein [Enterococcus faecalis]MDN3115223.1 recombinase family protein [Enterococcus faecalis]HBC4465827.1 recombinase family protein [Enterococcus faecalis]